MFSYALEMSQNLIRLKEMVPVVRGTSFLEDSFLVGIL